MTVATVVLAEIDHQEPGDRAGRQRHGGVEGRKKGVAAGGSNSWCGCSVGPLNPRVKVLAGIEFEVVLYSARPGCACRRL